MADFAFFYFQMTPHLENLGVIFFFPISPQLLIKSHTKKETFTDKYMETLTVTRISVLNIDTNLNAKSRATYNLAFTFPFTYIYIHIYISFFFGGELYFRILSPILTNTDFFSEYSSVLKSRNVTLYHSMIQEATQHLGQQNRDLHVCLK